MNVHKLKEKMVEQYMTVEEVARQIGLSPYIFRQKLKTPMTLTIGDAIRLTSVLGLTYEEANDIFLI